MHVWLVGHGHPGRIDRRWPGSGTCADGALIKSRKTPGSAFRFILGQHLASAPIVGNSGPIYRGRVVQIKIKSHSHQTSSGSMKEKKFHFAGFIERLLPSSLTQRLVTPVKTSPVSKRKKVLVVDDDPLFQKVISQKLKANGYSVLNALDGAEAITAMREEQPDAVLLDVNFPPDIRNGVSVPWDGFKLMDWIRFIEGRAGIPMFIMTSDDIQQHEAKAKAGGAKGIFHKPLDQSRLLSEVEQILEEKAVVA
jgi:CheY-like chemotaxis protein